MRLLAIPDESGRPVRWINAEHLVSVDRLDLQNGRDVRLIAELKVNGLSLFRVELGTFASTDAADPAWSTFLERLQS